MIRAEHKKWAHLVFDIYLNRIIRKDFQNFYLIGDIPEFDNQKGVIITPNHFSWWDGFFIYYIMKKFSSRDLYIMMLEDQLKKYSFFKKLGAFSINQQHPKSIIESINYASTLIRNDSYLVIYPQGEIEPYEKRPLTVKEGLNKIIEKTEIETDIIPVSFKIHHSNQRKPFLYAIFGNPISTKKVHRNFKLFNDNFNNTILKLDSDFQTAKKISVFEK